MKITKEWNTVITKISALIGIKGLLNLNINIPSCLFVEYKPEFQKDRNRELSYTFIELTATSYSTGNKVSKTIKIKFGSEEKFIMYKNEIIINFKYAHTIIFYIIHVIAPNKLTINTNDKLIERKDIFSLPVSTLDTDNKEHNVKELLNQIEKIENNLNKIKNTIGISDYKDIFDIYSHIERDTKRLLNQIEIDALESGIHEEKIASYNFNTFIDYFLKGSIKIDLELPKYLLDCHSKYHINRLLNKKAILKCTKKEGVVICNFNFISNNDKSIKENYENLYIEQDYDMNITWIEGLVILDRVVKFTHGHYLESLNVKCI